MLRPSGVSSGSEASWARSARCSRVTPGAGTNSTACRLPSVIVPVLSSSRVLTSPAASTARPLMAITLCWIMRSMPAMPIADSSPPMVVGIRHTSSETRIGIETDAAGVDRERLQRHHGEQEDDRQTRQQNDQRDLIRRLLPLGALHQVDHAIEERLPWVRRDADDEVVGQHLGAAGDRRAVAARLADHGRGFSGDRRFVHRGDARRSLRRRRGSARPA